MYADPKRVRRRQTVYLDEYEMKMLEAIADYTGDSKSATARKLLLLGAENTLGIDHTSGIEEFIDQVKAGKSAT